MLMFDPTILSRFDLNHIGPVQKSNFGDLIVYYQVYPLEMVEKGLVTDRKWL